MKSRDRSFQSSGAGKGDADRTTDDAAYRRNFDQIDWGHPVFSKYIVPILHERLANPGTDEYATGETARPGRKAALQLFASELEAARRQRRNALWRHPAITISYE